MSVYCKINITFNFGDMGVLLASNRALRKHKDKMFMRFINV